MSTSIPSKGFTLIETVIYIALLGVIMSGTVFTAYILIGNTGALDTHTRVQEEGNFIIRKFEWAVSSASSFDLSRPHQITILRYDGSTIVFKQSNTSVVMNAEVSSFVPITTENVTVTDLTFTDIPATSERPRGIAMTLGVDGKSFASTFYLKK